MVANTGCSFGIVLIQRFRPLLQNQWSLSAKALKPASLYLLLTSTAQHSALELSLFSAACNSSWSPGTLFLSHSSSSYHWEHAPEY